MSARTVRLHRVLRADPEHLYRAFLDADAMSKWLPPYGFTCKVHLLDAKVGGTFRMSFTNFTTGNGHSFGGAYQQLVPESDSLCGKVRRPAFAWRDGNHRHFPLRFVRH